MLIFSAFQQIIMPIAYQYNPQLVLVAAGFDAAQGDPLGGKLRLFNFLWQLFRNLFHFQAAKSHPKDTVR